MAEKSAHSVEQIELPAIYFNGFQMGMGNSDISAILLLNGQPQTLVNMSYTTAKSLAVSLNTMIEKLETATDRPIMTTGDVDNALRQQNKKGGRE